MDCMICQLSLEDDSRISLPCENCHAFHTPCITKWFQNQAFKGVTLICPICRCEAENWRTDNWIQGIDAGKVAVHTDYTVLETRKQLSYITGYPMRCISIPGDDGSQKRNETPFGEQQVSFKFDVLWNTSTYWVELDIPRSRTAPIRLVCPLSNGLLLNPVLASNGITYEKAAIRKWIETRGISSPKKPYVSLLPLTPLRDPDFDALVRAIVPDAPVVPLPLDTEITVFLVAPMADPRPFTVTLGDTFEQVAHRVMPNANRVLNSNGVLFTFIGTKTLAQGRIANGAHLHVLRY